jgi:zinc protease
MKYLTLILILFMVCFTTAQAEETTKTFPYSYEVKVLENGFKVIMIPLENPGLVAYYSILRTGSRDEYEPGHSGFAHFFEHMMFRGTKKYPGDVYDKMITEMGASANAYTSFDLTVFHLVVAREDLEKVIELESDRFQNLSYSESEFKTEAGAVHGEYLKGLSNPYFAVYEKLMNTAFDAHTYKHTVIGFKQDIEAMPSMYEYSKSFYHRYYRPENVILLIVGDFDTISTLDLVKKYYGNWQKGYVPPQIPEEPEQKRERDTDVTFNGKTLPILCVAYKALEFDPASRDMGACNLLGELAFGETSDIYKKLVLNQQRVEFIQADFFSNRDPGLMTIYTMIKDEQDIDNIKQEIYQNIEFFQNNYIEEQRLNDLKNHLKYQFLMGLDTAENTASNLAGFLALSGDISGIETLYQTYDAVSPVDIMNAAKKFLVQQKRTVVVVKGGDK